MSGVSEKTIVKLNIKEYIITGYSRKGIGTQGRGTMVNRNTYSPSLSTSPYFPQYSTRLPFHNEEYLYRAE